MYVCTGIHVCMNICHTIHQMLSKCMIFIICRLLLLAHYRALVLAFKFGVQGFMYVCLCVQVYMYASMCVIPYILDWIHVWYTYFAFCCYLRTVASDIGIQIRGTGLHVRLYVFPGIRVSIYVCHPIHKMMSKYMICTFCRLLLLAHRRASDIGIQMCCAGFHVCVYRYTCIHACVSYHT